MLAGLRISVKTSSVSYRVCFQNNEWVRPLSVRKYCVAVIENDHNALALLAVMSCRTEIRSYEIRYPILSLIKTWQSDCLTSYGRLVLRMKLIQSPISPIPPFIIRDLPLPAAQMSGFFTVFYSVLQCCTSNVKCTRFHILLFCTSETHTILRTSWILLHNAGLYFSSWVLLSISKGTLYNFRPQR